jgi:hypothetical protein
LLLFFFLLEETVTADELRAVMTDYRKTVVRGSLTDRLDAFMFGRRTALPPRDKSDKTCHARLLLWLRQRFASGELSPDETLPEMLRLAAKASGPYSRRPNGVFMSMIKKRYGYLG